MVSKSVFFQKSNSRVLTTLLLLIILFMGLTGSFFSIFLGVEKFHYYIIIPCLIALFISSLNVKTFLLFILPITYLIVIFIFTPFGIHSNSILSFSSIFLMPIIFYSAGSKLDVFLFKRGILCITLFLSLGLLLEVWIAPPDFFPFIGYEINGEIRARYGSFTLHPYALGYFAVYSAGFALLQEKKLALSLQLILALILLFYANARNASLVLLMAIVVYCIIKKSFTSLYYFIFIGFIFFISEPDRALSVINWTHDDGNVGRIHQWNLCYRTALDHPIFGVGPGYFSPVGGVFTDDSLLKSCESFPLMLLSEYGFVIFFAYVFIFYRTILSKIFMTFFSAGYSITNTSTCIFLAINIGILFMQLVGQSLGGIFLGGMFFLLSGYINSNIHFNDTKK